MMEILGLLLVILLGVGVYVFFKNKEDKDDVQEPVVTPELWGVSPENIPPVATGSISLAPPPYPALTATEAVALTIAKVAESKQETVVAETPVVVTVAEETPVPKVPAKRGPAAKSTTTKTKKKK